MFYIHKRGPSSGAQRLRRELHGKIWKPSHILKSSDVVINWGDSQCPVMRCLNRPEAISLASNKLRCFKELSAKNVPVPRFAESPEAVTWKKDTVVRHKLTGHSGEGIEIVKSGSPLPSAPLYVEYIKKEQEYRIHVGRRTEGVAVIAVQRKARSLDVPVERVNWQVRNHCNGFIFVRSNVSPPQSVIDAAKSSLVAVGLDFGAVDVIYNDKEGKAYVLEINTAPGLEGQTPKDYAQYFKGHTGMEVSG